MRLALLAGVALLALAGAAAAQDITAIQPAPEYSRGQNTAVRERRHPEWESRGLHVGAFLMQPQVIVTTQVTDNERDVSTDKEADLIVRVSPSLSFASDWGRHGVGGTVWLARNQNLNVTEDSSTEYGLRGAGRLDVSKDLVVDLKLQASRLSLPSSDPDIPTDRLEPALYDRRYAQLVVTQTLPRIQFQGTLNYLGLSFDPVRVSGGSRLDLSARDLDYANLAGRATYAISPEVGVFVGALVDRTARPALNGLDQGSHGFTLGGGANFDLTRLARGEIQLGYLSQTAESGSGADASGLSVNGSIQYFPTQLTTISVSLARQAVTGGASPLRSANIGNVVAGAPGGIVLSGDISVDHELLRNLIVSARLSGGAADYTRIDRHDQAVAAAVGATYLVNRNIAADLELEHRDFQSSGVNQKRSYADNRLTLTLRLSY